MSKHQFVLYFFLSVKILFVSEDQLTFTVGPGTRTSRSQNTQRSCLIIIFNLFSAMSMSQIQCFKQIFQIPFFSFSINLQNWGCSLCAEGEKP